MTLNIDLTLSLRSEVMGSAHGLTERSICVKCNKTGQRGLGNMEHTQNYRVKYMYMTLANYLDLESA